MNESELEVNPQEEEMILHCQERLSKNQFDLTVRKDERFLLSFPYFWGSNLVKVMLKSRLSIPFLLRFLIKLFHEVKLEEDPLPLVSRFPPSASLTSFEQGKALSFLSLLWFCLNERLNKFNQDQLISYLWTVNKSFTPSPSPTSPTISLSP